jgi:hypothetical protein
VKSGAVTESAVCGLELELELELGAEVEELATVSVSFVTLCE